MSYQPETRGHSAYKMGQYDNRAGKPESDCPYVRNSIEEVAWLTGWHEVAAVALQPTLHIRESSDKAAVVDTAYQWLPIDKNTPQGKKIQLIRAGYGVATYGVYTTDNPSGWTHWAPVPTMPKGA